MRISIKVVPGASNSCVAGWLGDELKIRVAVPPEKGKANAAVETVVAKALHLPRDNVSIVRGKTSQRKVLEITGLSEDEVHRRLER